jgi:hypothetical protein
MDIVRNDDGTLTVPVTPDRHAETELDAAGREVPSGPTTITLHPGEGGYDEALAEWDLQQDPDRGAAVSTASGRDEAMAVVHNVAEHSDDEVADAVADAVDELDDPEASAEALRHVLVGGVPSVDAFAAEVAESEGGEPVPAHRVTKIIGQVLAEIDS